MTPRSIRTIALALLIAVVAAACGNDDDADVTVAPPPGPPTTVYAVEVGGGFVPVEAALAEAPRLVILSDGTVFRPGVTTAIFPGPALPVLETTTLSEDELAEVLGLVSENADLFLDVDFGQPPVADVPTTTVTALVGEERLSASAFALGMSDAGGLTDEQVELRTQLQELIDAVDAIVDDPDRTWQLADPPALLIRSLPATTTQPEVDPGPPVDFPLDAGSALVPGPDAQFGCLAVTEPADLAAVLEAAADATQITPWVVDGQELQLVFAPLYPHEDGCGG